MTEYRQTPQRPSGPPTVATHYVCAKGNDHWLSHVSDWGPAEQNYLDGCLVSIQVEGGHVVHLKVLPDKEPAYA
jgi:hypothetical protein